MNTQPAHPSRRSQPVPATRRARRRSALVATWKAVPLAAALLLGGGAALAQTYYRAQALPELRPEFPFNQDWTTGWALNDSAVVVGGTGGATMNNAVRWSFADGLQLLGSPARALAINNNGTAVGTLDMGSPDGLIPVRWSPTLGYAPLRDVYAGAPLNGHALAINDQDWVLTWDRNEIAGIDNVVLLRPGQDALSLGKIGRFGLGSQTQLNNSGMVAGWVQSEGGTGEAQGFIWTEAGGPRNVSLGPVTIFNGLSDNGLVVGSTSATDGTERTGIVYDANAGAVIQNLSGFLPADINNAGTIVGFSSDGRPAVWRNGAAVELNRIVADLGIYTLGNAYAINNNGQILAIGGLPPGSTVLDGPPARTFLLSECLARCGQIKPNPNPASTLLDIGPDWFDPFNAEDYLNEGTLQIRTRVTNVQGSFLRNGGDIEVLGSAGNLFNTGSLNNGPGGRIIVSGALDSGGAGGVVNRAAVRVLEGGSVYVGGSKGFINSSLSRFTQVGGSVRNATLFGVEGALFDQQGGSFENQAGATFRLWGGDAVIGASFTNAGTLLMGPEELAPIDSPSRPSQMRISGTLDNQAGAVFEVEGGSLIEVTGGQLSNRGQMTLESGSTHLSLRSGGSLDNHGGTLRLGSGSRLLIAEDGGRLQQLSGNLFVANGARIEIEQTRNLDVVGGRLSNEGVIVARSAARIANSSSFQLQTGSRLELDGGASFDQGAGELLVAAGASIVGGGLLNHFGGTTTVNGSVSLPMSVFNGGVLAGSGFISGAVLLGSTIDLRPGNSPGTLTFLGDVDMADANIELEIESHRSFDKIVVAGNLNVGQVTVRWSPSAGYVPDLNDSFVWLSTGSLNGNDLQIDTSTLPDGWRGVVGNGGGTIDLWNDAAVALAPNPNPAGAVLKVEAGTLAHHSSGNGLFSNEGTLEVAGSLANRHEASLIQGADAALKVLAEGRLSNRGFIGNQGSIDNAGTLINYQDGTISASGLANRGRMENDGELGIGISLNNEAGGTVVNRGLITTNFVNNQGRFENLGRLEGFVFTNSGGAEFVVSAGGVAAFTDYRDFGGTTQVDGRLEAGRVLLQGALLRGHGTLAGPVQLIGAQVTPDVGSGLTIEGDLQGNSASFYVGWSGAGLYSQLYVTGNLNLSASRVYFVLSPDGYVPQAGDRVEWLSVDGTAQGLDTLNWRIVTQSANAQCPGCELYDWTPPDDLRVSFNGGVLSLQPVPEPGTWLMMALGMAALAAGRWRRRTVANGPIVFR